jgi:hypothetical protein
MYFITAIFKLKRLECVGIKFVQKSALSSASKLGIKNINIFLVIWCLFLMYVLPLSIIHN